MSSSSGRGRLIVIEGIDGSGKSTLAASVVNGLRKRGVSARSFRGLAGDTEFVASVKQAQHSIKASGWKEGGQDRDFFAVYFSFVLAANAQRFVLPALEAGTTVVCDRWLWSHLANQQAFDNSLDEFEELFASLPSADRTFWLDVEPSLALQRASLRDQPGVGDNLAFMQAVQESFRAFAREHNFVRLDGSRPQAALTREVVATITSGQ